MSRLVVGGCDELVGVHGVEVAFGGDDFGVEEEVLGGFPDGGVYHTGSGRLLVGGVFGVGLHQLDRLFEDI